MNVREIKHYLCDELICDGVYCKDCPVNNLIPDLQSMIYEIRGYDGEGKDI